MLVLLIMSLLGIQSSLVVQATVEPIHTDWVKADSVFISSWITTVIHHPTRITQQFPVRHNPFNIDTLGFGYTMFSSSAGKGYVSCFYKLLFHDGILVSFELSPELPHDPRLAFRYRQFYSSLFTFCHDGRSVKPYRWGPHNAQSAIDDRQFRLALTTPLDSAILELMAPFIGIDYGITGGEASDTLPSRRLFERLKPGLDDNALVCLLHGINPSTRLMVIEYLENKSHYVSIDSQKLANDISVVYSRHPRARTMNGCIVDIEDARTLVRQYANR
jgi:hypothetical protein